MGISTLSVREVLYINGIKLRTCTHCIITNQDTKIPNNQFSASHLKLLQYFVCLASVLAKVLELLALWAAAVVLHLGALGVDFGALRLVAHRSIFGAHARAVRVAGEETFSELVDEATVVHAAFAAVVIEQHLVGVAFGLVGCVVLGNEGG